MVALQDLSFFKEKEVTQLRGYVEILWRKVDINLLLLYMNSLKEKNHQKPCLN